MKRRNVVVLGIIAAILAFAISALILPLFGRQGLQLGLDLKGGVNLVYQVQFPNNASAQDKTNIINRTITVITERIDKYGVTSPVIQSLGTDRVSIQLPGYTDIATAKQLVEQTGFLEFRDVELDSSGNPVYLSDYLADDGHYVDASNKGTRIFADQEGNPVAILQVNSDGTYQYMDAQGNPISVATLKARNDTNQLYSWVPARGDDGTILTGDLLTSATAELSGGTTTAAKPEVAISWNKEGTTIFDQIAARLYKSYNGPGTYNIKAALGIFLDNSLLSFPQITQSSYGGSGVITGSFTMDAATRLANLLSSGSLPMPLVQPPLYQDVVSATLGSSFIDMSVLAGIVALILIMIFMMLYYRIPGVMASLALLFYSAVILAIIKLIPVTLNLAAIGGFVLSLGMAVDANVIIFERMKEEIRLGKTLRSSIDAGFHRAWLAIRDSNITTFIACIILYWVGNSVIGGDAVKGFALTLFIGVAVSMFTCVTVTRALLNIFIGTHIGENTSLFSVWSGRK